MKTENTDTPLKADCPSVPCSASSDTPETDAQANLTGAGGPPIWHIHAEFSRKMERERNRLRELLDDHIRDKRQIGKDLGLAEDERLHHRFQRRIICDIQRENRMMRMALEKIHERMKGPANNRTFMQIAGPARECLNLAKPFLPNARAMAQGAPESPEK